MTVFSQPARIPVAQHAVLLGAQLSLAGIGLSTDLAAIRTVGLRPLLLGGLLSVLVAGTTLTTMALTGHLG